MLLAGCTCLPQLAKPAACVRAGGVALFGPSSAPDEDSPTIEFQVPAGVRRLWDLEEDMPDDYDPNTAQSFVDYNFVADYGFDPLGLSRFDLHLGGAADKERPLQQVLRDYREAELRHGRLAMIAALAWPVQELLSPALSRALRQPILLTETAGRTPSVLNGGLEQATIPYTIAALFVLIGWVDTYSLRLKAERGDDWLPGDFAFDPLRILTGCSLAQRRDMQASEINHGRLAMVAIVAMVSARSPLPPHPRRDPPNARRVR